jgi:hypothetical protein
MTREQATAWLQRVDATPGRWVLDVIHNTPTDYLAWKGTRSAGVFVTIDVVAGRVRLVIGDYKDGFPNITDGLFTAAGRKFFTKFGEALEFMRRRGGQNLPSPERF